MLHVQVTTCGRETESLCFKIADFHPVQLSDALNTELTPGKLYHLRPQHPAIDGVGVFEVENKKYLVMIQVSLSTYRNHASKALDIFRTVKKLQESTSSTTIVEYYKKLAKVDDNTRVVYIDASPQELYERDVDLVTVFSLPTITTRGGNKPQGLFGLVIKDSTTDTIMKIGCEKIGYDIR